jgi:hypothetical protein
MAFCDRCGSSSRDSEGFCGGCGALISVEEAAVPGESVGVQQQKSSSQKPAAHISFFTLVRPASKSVWVAGLLTLFFGPMGMLYSTRAGCYVMTTVSIAMSFSVKGWIPWLIFWPLCIFWAVMAARD